MLTLFKYMNRQNNHGRSSSYIDILINRSLYMTCQTRTGFEPSIVHSKCERPPH